MKVFVLLLIALSISSCAIRQTVEPVKEVAVSEVCIIDNPAVRPGFLQAYRGVLQQNGCIVKILPQTASITDCGITSTYIARWSWDLAIYMSYADIKVYHDGRQIGSALYDSRRGGMRFDKFIDGDAKTRELATTLFPVCKR